MKIRQAAILTTSILFGTIIVRQANYVTTMVQAQAVSGPITSPIITGPIIIPQPSPSVWPVPSLIPSPTPSPQPSIMPSPSVNPSPIPTVTPSPSTNPSSTPKPSITPIPTPILGKYVIGGRITTGFGFWRRPVPNARVMVINSKTYQTTSVETNSKGYYVAFVNPGRYVVDAIDTNTLYFKPNKIRVIVSNKNDEDNNFTALPNFRNLR